MRSTDWGIVTYSLFTLTYYLKKRPPPRSLFPVPRRRQPPPTKAPAPQGLWRDLIIAHPVEHPTPTVAVLASAESCPGTVLLTDNDNERPCPREYLPYQNRPQRAKEVQKRSFCRRFWVLLSLQTKVPRRRHSRPQARPHLFTIHSYLLPEKEAAPRPLFPVLPAGKKRKNKPSRKIWRNLQKSMDKREIFAIIEVSAGPALRPFYCPTQQ